MNNKIPRAKTIVGSGDEREPLFHQIYLPFPFAIAETEVGLTKRAWVNMQVGSKARGLVRVFRAPSFLNSDRFLSIHIPSIQAPSNSSLQQWRPHSAFSSLSLPFSGTFPIFHFQVPFWLLGKWWTRNRKFLSFDGSDSLIVYFCQFSESVASFYF